MRTHRWLMVGQSCAEFYFILFCGGGGGSSCGIHLLKHVAATRFEPEESGEASNEVVFLKKRKEKKKSTWYQFVSWPTIFFIIRIWLTLPSPHFQYALTLFIVKTFCLFWWATLKHMVGYLLNINSWIKL